MKIPLAWELMKPVLQALGDGKQAHKSTVRDRFQDILGLTEDDIRQETGRIGGRRRIRPVFGQRVVGACGRLRNNGLLEGGAAFSGLQKKAGKHCPKTFHIPILPSVRSRIGSFGPEARMLHRLVRNRPGMTVPKKDRKTP